MATRWIDKETFDMDEVMKKITDLDNKESSSEDSGDEDIKNCNWEIDKKFNDNIEVKFNNRNITFNYIYYRYNRVIPGDNPISDRTISKDGFVIVYHDGNNINYIINRNSDAKRNLRLLLGYSGRSEVSENDHEIDGNMFIWLISRVYNSYNKLEIEDGEKELKIDAIKGFRGDSNDLLTKVSAHGESVMNIISTLSFLLESNQLNQVTLDTSYSEHDNIELVINVNNSLTIDEKKYMGIYNEDSKYISISKLYLFVYLELIPQIIQSYKGDIEDGHWNKTKNVDFLKDVAEDLSKQVKEKLNNLENE